MQYDISQALLHFPHLLYAITLDDKSRRESSHKNHKITVKTQLKLLANQWITLEAAINSRTIANTTGKFYSRKPYFRDNQFEMASSISTDVNSRNEIRVTNKFFHILSPQEAKQLRLLNFVALKVLEADDSEQTLEYVD